MNIKQKMLANTLLTGLGLLALLLLLLKASATLKQLSVHVSQGEQLNTHILALRKHEKDFFMEVVKLLDILKSHKNTNIIYINFDFILQ